MIQEGRAKVLWRALPRKVRDTATQFDEAADGTPWYPRHHEWNGQVPTRVRCWKCGVDLKSWRAMLVPHKTGFTPEGKPITVSEASLVKIGGKPAVAFLPLPHMTSTTIGAYLPTLNQTVRFAAQHCADCQIVAADAEKIVTCFLAGTDAILWNAWNHNSARSLTPDRWATFLYRWHNAEPIGPLTEKEAAMAESVPAPGELITAAQVMVNQDLAMRAALPSGAVIEFEGDQEPPGWMFHPTKPGRLLKL